MNFIEKIRNYLNRSKESLFDGKYRRLNTPELKSEKKQNQIHRLDSSVKGVRPYANLDEKDVSGRML